MYLAGRKGKLCLFYIPSSRILWEQIFNSLSNTKAPDEWLRGGADRKEKRRTVAWERPCPEGRGGETSKEVKKVQLVRKKEKQDDYCLITF